MPLVVATLQNDLSKCFNDMNDITDGTGNKYMAENVAKAISNFVKTGIVTSVDSGTASDGGVYAGAGTGTMEIKESDLKDKLQKTFEANYENNDLATHIADDIDSIISEKDTCSTDTIGTSSIPPKTNPANGKGKGTFTGVKSTIESVLKSTFNTMNNMVEGGNDFLASQWASCLQSYLTAGIINIQLQSPMSGAGVGAIA